MVRMRGGGQAVLTVRTLDGPESPVGQAPGNGAFDDVLVQGASGPGVASYAWTGGQIRPVAVIIHPLDTPVEVDCVVPFLTR
jgi:hypothetical protein